MKLLYRLIIVFQQVMLMQETIKNYLGNPSLTAINLENQLITRFRPAKGPKAQTFGPFLLYLKQG